MKKTDITTFLTELLKRYGCKGVRVTNENINCSCPFHDPLNNQSSFGISITKEEEGFPFQCMSNRCGEVGNVFKLIAHLHRCDYRKAQRIFNKRVLVSPINLNILSEMCESINTANKVMNEQVEIQYPPPSNKRKKMLKYLKWRNDYKQHNALDIDYIVKKYGLYYCNEGRYTDRIIMPIRDLNGEWVQFNDRALNHDIRQKSLHQFNSKIEYHLHGIYEAYGKKAVIITEGAFDMWQCACVLRKSREFKEFGAVNSMGTHITEQRAALLAELFEKAYIFYDHDDSGIVGSYKAEALLRDYMDVENVTMNTPAGKDPAICTPSQIRKALRTKRKGILVKCHEMLDRLQ